MLAPVDEDLPELDIPDILQALLATDDPSALFQTGVPAHQPMTMFSTPFCPASLPVGVDINIGVGTVLVGQQSEPAVQAQTDAQKTLQKQKEQPRPRGFDVQLQRYIARRKFEQNRLASRSETCSLEAAAKTQARRERALKRVRGARGRYMPKEN